MKSIDDVIAKYREINKEEELALKMKQKQNNIPYRKDLAQIIEANSLLKNGMIVMRKHPRFCYVSKHSHNYLEVNYVLSGEIHQIVDGDEITLKKGEMIFLSKNSSHEFLPAGEDDILINFIILPEFFDFIFPFIDQKGVIKNFLVNLLSKGDENNSLIFHVADCPQVQNIITNIFLSYEEQGENLNNLLRFYFILLINEMMKYTDKVEETKTSNYDSILLFKTYNYIENNFSNANLQDLSILLKEDYNYTSKKIKKLTGLSFQTILEEQRLKVAKSLLETTDIKIEDIAYHVGYNNLTFFYSIFRKKIGMTPYKYRQNQKSI